MAETLEDIIRERLLAKHPNGGGGDSPFFARRQSRAHLVVRVLVRQHDDDDGNYANETYDVVVFTKDAEGKEEPRHFDVEITAETYRQVAYEFALFSVLAW